MSHFVDRVKLHVIAGRGGHGCVSIKREKFKPLGGPDGGNGGHGGSIIVRADEQCNTLLEYHYSPHRKAKNGEPGKGDMRHGKNAEDEILNVPCGTVVKDEDGTILADLTQDGAEYVIAEGGQGGLGNAALATRKRKAPGFALLGTEGEEHDVVLEVKSMADIALVGFPSAGKSSLIAALSAARPKIADYPFTTLVPNLGVVEAGDVRFTVADVPGLIPGASEGKGLGHEFLRHIERCAAIVHVLDCASLESERDPLADLAAIEEELHSYAGDELADTGLGALSERPRLVVLNKIDVPDGAAMAEMVRDNLRDAGYKVFEISAVTHQGLRPLSFAMAELVAEAREAQAAAAAENAAQLPVVTLPAGRGKKKPAEEFTIRREERNLEPLWRVRGRKPERWVQQTDFNNDEAVGYLADRLNGLGVEEELFALGARAGDAVVIGPDENSVIFDWEPTLTTGAELLGSPRGTDIRLDQAHRPTREEKRQDYQERKDARAAVRAEMEAERLAEKKLREYYAEGDD